MHAMCEQERPNEEQPYANAGHDLRIPPAASRHRHPWTIEKFNVRASVHPGPEGLQQVDGRILPRQHGGRYRGESVGRNVRRVLRRSGEEISEQLQWLY
ncbi:hypothetical protein T02_14432 [Trichinella nativa]|uniref:Uncharacterized protein n=1 Tax=Trichinella nativa TaxID=6335 RepID=A0A0V1L8L6_9BILA|nr:hypothetical protein T02_14432 [Trichinella nativa]